MREWADASPRWEVSTRSSGEVLTASAVADDLSLTLIGVPDGFTPREISGWLEDVAGVARETSSADAAPKPIPHLLHHALTGLLFSQSELWSQTPGPAPCSVGFVRSETEVGFGWVGDADVWVWLDGNPIEVQWVLIRDSLGRTACAWSIDPGHSLAVRLRWSASPGDPAAPTVDIDAVWSNGAAEITVAETSRGELVTPEAEEEVVVHPAAREAWTTTSRPAPSASPAPAPSQTPEPPPVVHAPDVAPEPEEIVAIEAAGEIVSAEAVSLSESADAPEPPSSGVARWLKQSVPWLKKPPRPAEMESPHPAEVEAARSEIVTPARSAERVAPAAMSETQIESGPVVDEPIVPLSSAIETHGFAAPIEVSFEHTARRSSMPEVIPPSPESIEITERAIRSRDTADPRSLSLPKHWDDPHARSIGPAPLPKHTPAAREGAPTQPPAAAPTHASASPPAAPTHATASPRAVRAQAASAPAARVAPAAPAVPAPPAVQAAPDIQPQFELGRVEVRSAPRAASAPAPVSEAEPETETMELAPEPEIGRAIEDDPRITFEPDPHPDTNVLRRASWPTAESLDEGEPFWKKPWVWAAAVGVLLVIAWIFAGFTGSRSKPATGAKPSPVVHFSGPRFKASVESDPAGAQIAIDGTDTGKQTPATIDVPVGDHQITLALPGLGSATYPVTGKKGDQVPVQAKLVGSLQVISPDPKAVISVAVDGEAKGFAPLELEGLTPGPHEVRFSGPGIASWGRTVEIRIGEAYPILTRALESPATGLIDVRATITDGSGQNEANGGQVWVDGVLRGAAPQTLELPRGPHSIRMSYRGQEAPIQLIDLPGGNQRFATFEFGPMQDIERPHIVLAGAVRVAIDKPAVVSATFENTTPSEVREMWLHVKSPEGAWRRMQMTLLSSQGTVVGVTPFPATLLDGSGKSTYYVSGIVAQGDEYFTELQQAQADKPR